MVTIGGTAGLFHIGDKQYAEKYRNTFRLTDKDDVKIFVMPKGQSKKMSGSFLYKTLSPKAKLIQAKIYELRRKIKELECSDIPHAEKARTLNRLRCLIKYNACRLHAEIEALPKSGFIVVDENE